MKVAREKRGKKRQTTAKKGQCKMNPQKKKQSNQQQPTNSSVLSGGVLARARGLSGNALGNLSAVKQGPQAKLVANIAKRERRLSTKGTFRGKKVLSHRSVRGKNGKRFRGKD